MRDQGPRYAIYYAPDAGDPLWRFGCHCIGYDAETGADCPVPQISTVAQEDWVALTQEPRRYGFHATLKAPFHLAEGASEGELIESLAQFAAVRNSFRLEDVDVRAIGSFVALTPGQPMADLQDLASDCVTRFDRFRAPLGESDLARRLAAPLTPRQKAFLQAWGYPYVMEEFRFHMTLTSSLPNLQQALMVAELGGRYRQEVKRTDLLINGFALFQQDTRDGRFRIARRFLFRPESKTQGLP